MKKVGYTVTPVAGAAGGVCATPMPVRITVEPDANCVACPASGPVDGPDAESARFAGDAVVPMYTLKTYPGSVGSVTEIDPVGPVTEMLPDT